MRNQVIELSLLLSFISCTVCLGTVLVSGMDGSAMVNWVCIVSLCISVLFLLLAAVLMQ